MATTWDATFAFRIGAAFPADDRIARYVMRLSIALGDLRIALNYATRNRQNNAERLYFVRLSASHLREIVSLLDPPDQTVLPTVEQFVLSLPRGAKPSRDEIRTSHRSAMRQIDAVMTGRPHIRDKDGRTRDPKLRDDLKNLRNHFFHYGHNKSGDAALRRAMKAVEENRSSYVIRRDLAVPARVTMRARYADIVGTLLAHPFDSSFAEDMHEKITDLFGPVSLYIQQVEAAWIWSRPSGVVTLRRPGKPTEYL